MCGIAGILNLKKLSFPELNHHLDVMNKIQSHRGPDDERTWIHERQFVGFAHRRLSIIDLSTGEQPMTDSKGNWLILNGEIYNFLELKEELKSFYSFKTTSDTEVVLAAYHRWGSECVTRLRGMFAFALWDETTQSLFCARDRFGIKPFYYTIQNGCFYFASEVKALLPFIKDVAVNSDALKDYFIFQFTLGEKTLFKDVRQLLPAHQLTVKNGAPEIKKYWEVHYTLDWDHTKRFFQKRLEELLHDSVTVHLRSDVPVGAYLSGGIDSSLIAIMGRKEKQNGLFKAFHGRFPQGKEYDESEYARDVAEKYDMELHITDITVHDFLDNIRKVIYHLDYPVAGPGSFPQYMVSKLAGKHLKVVLGGQGGDEVFGGYARYLLAYFEQCIKGAIEGTMHSGNFVVTYESIIPNLQTLREYKPLMQEFWMDGLFDERDKRYFKLVNRANMLQDEVNWDIFESYSAFEVFKEIFWGNNVEKESYFDSMTHFDFKTLLPALLQVEDRMSMAHGLESRVPILDHPLIEFIATAPANIKFEGGQLKHLLKTTFGNLIPETLLNRKDKMGFPVPLSEWYKKELKEFVLDIFHSQRARTRFYLSKNISFEKLLSGEGKYNRKLWGLLSLELWQQQFIDTQPHLKKQASYASSVKS
ncbi:MAG TPA: asparagine synthase (glutamine-hydrolyzing) [Chitinophagales bacterium]|nr:asparagine synthase (glutamine-hydrolyzing) [Chitinophagales bacterium]